MEVATETEIVGVTQQGFLITRQQRLTILPEVERREIVETMDDAGGVRVELEGKGRELENSWAVPDGAGNWLLVIDLKPANVLYDGGGHPKIIDGILIALTPVVLEANPYLASRFPAENPAALF